MLRRELPVVRVPAKDVCKLVPGAVKPPFHRPERAPGRLGDLVVTQAFELAENEDIAMGRREEPKLHSQALAALVLVQDLCRCSRAGAACIRKQV